MSILIVVQREAKRGQAEALLAAARERWQQPERWQPGRQRVRHLQSPTVPERLLYLAEWSSVEAYTANRAARPPDRLEALCVAPAEPRCFVHRWLYEQFGKAPQVVNAVTFAVPAAALSATLEYLDTGCKPAVREAAGLVLHALYEDADDPTRLLMLTGWANIEAFEHFYATQVPEFFAAHRARGVTVEHLVGRLRADVDPWPA